MMNVHVPFMETLTQLESEFSIRGIFASVVWEVYAIRELNMFEQDDDSCGFPIPIRGGVWLLAAFQTR